MASDIIAPSLVPGLLAPTQYRAIVNAHFRIAPPKDFPPMIGVLGATVEWIFGFPDRLSVTISGADRLLDQSREPRLVSMLDPAHALMAGGVAGDAGKRGDPVEVVPPAGPHCLVEQC